MVRDSYLGCTISSLPSKIGDGRRLHRITDMEEAGLVQVHLEGHFESLVANYGGGSRSKVANPIGL